MIRTRPTLTVPTDHPLVSLSNLLELFPKDDVEEAMDLRIVFDDKGGCLLNLRHFHRTPLGYLLDNNGEPLLIDSWCVIPGF